MFMHTPATTAIRSPHHPGRDRNVRLRGLIGRSSWVASSPRKGSQRSSCRRTRSWCETGRLITPEGIATAARTPRRHALGRRSPHHPGRDRNWSVGRRTGPTTGRLITPEGIATRRPCSGAPWRSGCRLITPEGIATADPDVVLDRAVHVASSPRKGSQPDGVGAASLNAVKSPHHPGRDRNW